MIFNSEYQIDVPNEDILTFLYSRTRFKEADPIWIDAADPRLHVTLSKARELTRRVGRGLRDLGIGGGKSEDIVLTFVENQVMVAPTLLGVLCAGGIHATCPMTATAFELGRQIRLSSPKVVICSRQTRKVAEEAIRIAQSGSSRGRGITPPQLLVMVSEDSDVIDDASPGKSIVSDRELQWESITDPDVLERTTACLVYSSGTTGLPKGMSRTAHGGLDCKTKNDESLTGVCRRSHDSHQPRLQPVPDGFSFLPFRLEVH
jgi:acyl-coenzyme A synthetase/AMP-(fatty) acid ligase